MELQKAKRAPFLRSSNAKAIDFHPTNIEQDRIKLSTAAIQGSS